MKFEHYIQQVLKIYEAGEAPSPNNPEQTAGSPAETTPTGASPDSLPPEEQMLDSPEEEFDIDEIIISTATKVMQALDYGRNNGRVKNVEIDQVLRNRPTTKEEALAKLDEIELLISGDIEPSTHYRGPGNK